MSSYFYVDTQCSYKYNEAYFNGGYHEKTHSRRIYPKVKEIHGDKYDYSKVVYVRGRYKVTIICPEHGEFELRPFLHWKGRGCQKCARKRCGRKKKTDTPS